MSIRTLEVAGMTCDHCVHAVTEELMGVDGVALVSIDLDSAGVSRVDVDSVETVTNEELVAAIVEAGYELAG
jgi:copper chaperone CopZ